MILKILPTISKQFYLKSMQTILHVYVLGRLKSFLMVRTFEIRFNLFSVVIDTIEKINHHSTILQTPVIITMKFVRGSDAIRLTSTDAFNFTKTISSASVKGIKWRKISIKTAFSSIIKFVMLKFK